jgi:hypothetical protein
VQYFKDEYAANSTVPSVRSVCEKFKLDTKSFYNVFPQGKREVCKLAGIPEDKKSFDKIEKARQALKKKEKKVSLENGELNVLRREKEKIVGEVEQAKTANEIRERIRELYIEKTRVSGVEDIFQSPERMLDFALHTLKGRGRMFNDVYVWDSFNHHCIKNNLDVAKTLFKTVGPLGNYKAEMDDVEDVDLDDYIQERLEDFLIELECEETQRVMQRKFEDVLRNFRRECGRDATTTYLENSELCPCGACRDLLCVNCKKELQFDPNIDALRCPGCGMSFKFVLR